ncbi:MAG: TonB family protein [Kordiimonadaceae bacterium]|nr:TonB family protein [Kordiimonadaceae bacterium]
MYKIFYSLLLIIYLLTAAISSADVATEKAEFKKLYADFNDLYANSDAIEPIIEVAEKLYSISPNLYGELSQTHAVITYNLATLYDEKGGKRSNDFEKKATKLYSDYFRILDKLEQPQDQDYLTQLVALIHAENNANTYESKFTLTKKALSIAKDLNLPKTVIANYELIFGFLRYKAQNISQSEDLFESAQEKFIEEYGDTHYKVGESQYWLGRIAMARNNKSKAEEKLLNALAIFDDKGEEGNTLSQSTHAYLVNLYEEMGQSDEATKHCQAVAVERPKGFDQFVDPLFRIYPNYPQSAMRGGVKGYSVVEFVVDTDGITRDVKVIDGSSKMFEKSSIEAAKKYRYAPSVKDGKLISTEGVRIRFIYELDK